MITAQLELTELLEKEVLPTLHYPQTDVLPTPLERTARRREADRAMALGNNYHGKVDIYFKTADGQSHRVYTTVWATSNEHITLKSGTTLPMRAVVMFDFY